MPPIDDLRARITLIWRWIASERERASRAAASAGKYERQATLRPESLRPLRNRMAALYRRMEARHLAAARLHELYASRLEGWLDDPGRTASRPAFMASVASALGMHGATVTLLGQRPDHALVAASDTTARAACDLEFILGEGPATAASEGRTVRAAGAALDRRWPHYGPAVTELGVQAVIAVPLPVPASCLGTLCAYGSQPDLDDGAVTAAGQIADALTYTVLAAHDPPPGGDVLPLPLFDDADARAVVHQAAGMVSVQCECGIGDALALLRARAFAAGQPIGDVALRVVRGDLHLR